MTPASAWTPSKIRDSTDAERIHERTAGRSLIFLKIHICLYGQLISTISSLRSRGRWWLPQTLVLIPAVMSASWGSLDCCPKCFLATFTLRTMKQSEEMVSQHPTPSHPSLGSFTLDSSSWVMRAQLNAGTRALPTWPACDVFTTHTISVMTRGCLHCHL